MTPIRLRIRFGILTRRDLSESGLQKLRWIGRKLVPAEIQVLGGPGPGFRRTGFWGPFGAHLGPILFGAHLGPILALAAIPFWGGYWFSSQARACQGFDIHGKKNLMKCIIIALKEQQIP